VVLGGGLNGLAAVGEPRCGVGRAGLLQFLFLRNSQQIGRVPGHRIASWTDYVANLFIINSEFCVLGEENESKSGRL